MHSGIVSRRRLLGGFGLGALGLALRPAWAAMVPDRFTLRIAGPEGGWLDRIGRILAPELAAALPPGAQLLRRADGGRDGVSGSNGFAGTALPDGRSLLLAPGAAALAWLVGDGRVNFDLARLVPVIGGASSGVVAGRLPPAGALSGAPWRVAADAPAGADLPALLAAELLGARLQPVLGLSGGAARRALAAGHVDAVFLRGQRIDVARQIAVLAAEGVPALFSLGVPDSAGGLARDPSLPALPDLQEFAARQGGPRLAGPLYAGWRSAAAASTTRFLLLLPPLTPPPMVALWRRAGDLATLAPSLRAQEETAGIRPLASPAADLALAAIAPSAEASLALRGWLARRFNWQAG